jgi:hypothetical protein
MKKIVLTFVAVFAFALVLAQAAEARGTKAPGGSTIYQTTSITTDNLTTPLLVVTVRAQGSNRFGHLYWSNATPSVSFDVFRNGKRITTVSGSTTGNNLYTDSVKRLRGTFTYQVCYAGTKTCSNSITVVYDSSTETIRYAPECPTTGTAKCIVTTE